MVWRPWPPAGGKEATLNLRQHADRRSAFIPGRVAIETDDGTVLKSLDQPRASFAGHTAETPWSTVQLAYFAGAAMWTYLTQPFSFTLPGLRTTELDPWEEAGQHWRRLQPSHLQRRTNPVPYARWVRGTSRRRRRPLGLAR